MISGFTTHEITLQPLSGFLNHCNGAEGTHDFGDLLQIRTHSSGKGGEPGQAPVPIPPLKQTNNTS